MSTLERIDTALARAVRSDLHLVTDLAEVPHFRFGDDDLEAVATDFAQQPDETLSALDARLAHHLATADTAEDDDVAEAALVSAQAALRLRGQLTGDEPADHAADRSTAAA
ncbi:hypothetical protein [Antribacter gilvus]|uniref:hypothetical protein n=1 Tax=Antribacter gilvus TaxID=2304675 RepID=UPI000F76961D|nr:hypothetical protein [Antribacter gilvus]